MKSTATSLRGPAILMGCAVAALLGTAFARGGNAPAQAATAPSSTPAQVESGHAAYAANCAMCHGPNLNDGSSPSLKNSGFRSTWLSKPPSALTALIRSSMPPNNVGGLSSETYANIAAYLLSTNLADQNQQTAPQRAPDSTSSIGVARGGSSGYAPMTFDTRPSKLLDALTPVTDESLTHPNDSDWLMWRRTYNGWGYSPLKQIDRQNVKHLGVAWTWTMAPGVSETTPLVHDGVLFVHNTGDRVQALDAATGDLLWEYVRKLTPQQIEGSGNQLTKRNMAIYGNMVITATSDVHLVALNQKTGALVWDVQIADWDKDYRLSGGPLVVDGKIIQGTAGCRSGQPGGCFITAHDPATGKELWRLHTVAQTGKEGDTWNGAPVEQRFGASAWMTGSYDPGTKTLYYGTGNSYGLIPNIYPAKPGLNNDALYTNSTLAIDPATGRLKWYFQHLQTDLLDMDYGFERMLIDLPIDGVLRHEVVTSGKTGIIEAVDAANGKWLWSKETVPQNIVLSIDPVTGRKTINPAILPGPNRVPYCPADPGGRGWPAPAYNPNTQTIFMPLNEFCSGALGLAPRPNSDGKIGRIDAINLATRETVWSARQRAPEISGLLPTGGGIVFGGDLDRYFSAYDDATGKILWRIRTNSVVNSFPITYSVKGKQYVAVVVGAGSTMPRQLDNLTREIPNPSPGTVLWVFALPDAAPAMANHSTQSAEIHHATR